MHQLFVDMREKMSDNQSDITYLSMGMSGDYADAIAEGSTLIRVGTALFLSLIHICAGMNLGAAASSARCRSCRSNQVTPLFSHCASRVPCLFGSIW